MESTYITEINGDVEELIGVTGFDEIEITFEYEAFGGFRSATWHDPAEYPEIEIGDILSVCAFNSDEEEEWVDLDASLFEAIREYFAEDLFDQAFHDLENWEDDGGY